MKIALYAFAVIVAIASNILLGILKKGIPYASIINSVLILTLLGFYYFA